MRTTLTLEDDVAARMRKLRSRGNFKQLVNEALRAGLDQLESPAPQHRYRMKTVDGHPAILNLDSIADVLAEVDDDNYK
jgi:hypothetical protein